MTVHTMGIGQMDVTIRGVDGYRRAPAWLVTCSCGYAGTPRTDRLLAERQRQDHTDVAWADGGVVEWVTAAGTTVPGRVRLPHRR